MAENSQIGPTEMGECSVCPRISDLILDAAFVAAHLFEKPNLGPLGLVPTGISNYHRTAMWAFLRHTEADESRLFSKLDGGFPKAHANILRQWAELAYWYPSLSDAVGSSGKVQTLTNINFTCYAVPTAKDPLSIPTFTHSYMVLGDPAQSWDAFRTLKTLLDPNADPSGDVFPCR